MSTRRLNFYDHTVLDRAGLFRKDEDWAAAALADPTTRLVPIWRSLNLFHEAEGVAPVFLAPDDLPAALLQTAPRILLGVEREAPPRATFAIDLSAEDEPLALVRDAARGAAFHDLRRFGPMLEPGEASILAYARGMAYWHARSRYCGVCGSPTASGESGHVRRCTDSACNTTHFPRTDPAVIVLVTDGDRCLLGRQPQWPTGMHSTLAGFVETGESLERAVEREVFEEAGVRVGDIVYHSSQPWPFPSSLMVGFHARALDTELAVDTDELETARWFERDWILEHTTGRDGDDQFRLPRRDSIARRLVEDWLAR